MRRPGILQRTALFTIALVALLWASPALMHAAGTMVNGFMREADGSLDVTVVAQAPTASASPSNGFYRMPDGSLAVTCVTGCTSSANLAPLTFGSFGSVTTTAKGTVMEAAAPCGQTYAAGQVVHVRAIVKKSNSTQSILLGVGSASNTDIWIVWQGDNNIGITGEVSGTATGGTIFTGTSAGIATDAANYHVLELTLVLTDSSHSTVFGNIDGPAYGAATGALRGVNASAYGLIGGACNVYIAQSGASAPTIAAAYISGTSYPGSL